MPGGPPSDTTLPSPAGEGAPGDGGSPGPETLLAGRYRLDETLGVGGAGRVFRAFDELTEQPVAVKLLGSSLAGSRPRVRREIAALRLLRIPGVVRLLDEGRSDGRPYLVMELVDGAPFPGDARTGPRSWDDLRDVALSLLEIVAQVHAAGVVHRDLKPQNVLVDPEGRPTVLDFGLSAGPSLGARITQDGTILGTLEYLSPEQCRGEPPDARSDLYAFGVMLFHALTGRFPHDREGAPGIIQAKLTQRATPVRRWASELPPAVVDAVDRLLATDPKDRPRSADDVFLLLHGDASPRGARRILPWLGSTSAPDSVRAHLLDRRSVDVVGGPGAGRSRLAREVTRTLQDAGVLVLSSLPGGEAFDSIAELVGGLDALADASLDAAMRHVTAELRRQLRGGAVLVVDDVEQIDRWSDRAVRQVRRHGPVLTTRRTRATERDLAEDGVVIELEPLSEADLRPLFHGPERLFHLPSDAARLLHARTGGRPAAVVAEVSAWIRAGDAHWRDDLLEVSRAFLDRRPATGPLPPAAEFDDAPAAILDPWLDELLAWIALAWPNSGDEVLATAAGLSRWRLEADLSELERAGAIEGAQPGPYRPLRRPQAPLDWTEDRRRQAHAAVADALPPGREGRLFHLVSAGHTAEIADESARIAEALANDGRLGEAIAALSEGLLSVRDDHADEGDLLTRWVKIALRSETSEALERVLFELGRAAPSDVLGRLEALARASLAANRGDLERARALTQSTPTFEDDELERWRQAVQLSAAQHGGLEREEEVLAEIGRWAEGSGAAEPQAAVAGWLGLLRYRQGRYLEAMELHRTAARGKVLVSGQVSSMLNCASAAMEAGLLDEAAELVSEAVGLAQERRLTRHEAHAAWLQRTIAYRQDRAGPVDVSLLEASRALELPAIEAMIHLSEAAVAWRQDERAIAHDLALRAAAAWRTAGAGHATLLAESLALACADGPPLREVLAVAGRALACPVADFAAQSLALLCDCVEQPDATWVSSMQERVAQIPEERRAMRADILSLQECLERLGG